MTGLEIATFAARVADEKKGGEIVIYDLRGLSDVADYFVIVTAQSKVQSRAIVDGIARGLKERGQQLLGREGLLGSQWLLLDYADTVIHVFSPSQRAYYALEEKWGDAPKVEWRGTTG